MKNTFFILLIFWLCYPFMGCSQNGVAKSRGGVVEYETLLDMTLDADRTGKSMVSFNKESERMYYNNGLVWLRLLSEADGIIPGTGDDNQNGIFSATNESDASDPNFIQVHNWFSNKNFYWDFDQKGAFFRNMRELEFVTTPSLSSNERQNYLRFAQNIIIRSQSGNGENGSLFIAPDAAVGLSALNGNTHLKFRTNQTERKSQANTYGGFLQMKDRGSNPTDGDYEFEISDWFAPLNKPAAGTYNWTFDEQGRANFTSAAHSTDANDKVVTCEWVQVNSLSNGQSATPALQGSPDFVTSINLKFTRDGRNYVGQAHYNFGSNALSGAEFIAEAYMDGATLNVVNESGETISAGFIEVCYSE